MRTDLQAVRRFPQATITDKIRKKIRAAVYTAMTGYRVTGERVHPMFSGDNFVNHLRVYQFASQFVAGKEVLDVGCGVGYGTAHLARTAKKAYGIDLSVAAIKEAYRLYPESDFAQMNAEQLSFNDQSFDFIISTENFEHLHDQAKHVTELARVLRKDGLCIIATPNPELFVGSNNKFHTKENSYPELMELLTPKFGQVEIIEPTKIPDTALGLKMRTERYSRGEHGKIVEPNLEIFGKPINQTYLSNSHSFICFVRP